MSRTQACLNFCSPFVVDKVQTRFYSSVPKSHREFPNKSWLTNIKKTHAYYLAILNELFTIASKPSNVRTVIKV